MAMRKTSRNFRGRGAERIGSQGSGSKLKLPQQAPRAMAGWSPSVRKQSCNVTQEVWKPGGCVLPLAQQLQHHSNAV